MSTIYIVEPGPIARVGATGALLLAAALREAGHIAIRLRLHPATGRIVEVGETVGDGDAVRSAARLPRPDAWFISMLYPRQMLALPMLFARIGLAPFRESRAASDPLVAFGGQAAIAPAPFARFADVVALGDGEATGPTLAAGLRGGKRFALDAVRGLPGFWCPPDEARLVRLEAPLMAPRIALSGQGDNPTLEIARGCASKCAFCPIGWAGGTYREANSADITAAIRVTKGRLNLFAPDYSSVSYVDEIETAVEATSCKPTGRDARFDRTLPRLDAAAAVRSYNFGIEGLSERLRAAIGKPLSDDALVDGMAKLSSVGRTKWYIILGLPGEDDSDIDAHIAVMRRVFQVYPGMLDVTCTYFQPVPHTPLGRCSAVYSPAVASRAERLRSFGRETGAGKMRVLYSQLKGRDLHESDVYTQRGGERVAGAVMLMGGTTGVNWRAIAHTRGLPESLAEIPEGAEPWAHVDVGVDRARLKRAESAYWRRMRGDTP